MIHLSGMHAAGPKNPLHGITLEKMVTDLQAHYGWDMLGRMIKINCFNWQPSVKSSLTFLRKTPWARQKVEELYVDSLPDLKAAERGEAPLFEESVEETPQPAEAQELAAAEDATLEQDTGEAVPSHTDDLAPQEIGHDKPPADEGVRTPPESA